MNTFLIYLTGNVHSFFALLMIFVVLSAVLCFFYNIDVDMAGLVERTTNQRVLSIIPVVFFMILTAILPNKDTLSAMVSSTVNNTIVEQPSCE